MKKRKCDICEKIFKLKFELTSHKQTHNREKPFKCDISEKECAQLST